MFRRQQSGPIGGLICGLLFAVIGYFVAFTFGKPILDNAKASRDWPSVPGVITRSAVATKRSDGKTMYSFDVVYRYQVEGRELTCNSVFFGGNTSSSNSAGGVQSHRALPGGRRGRRLLRTGEPRQRRTRTGHALAELHRLRHWARVSDRRCLGSWQLAVLRARGRRDHRGRRGRLARRFIKPSKGPGSLRPRFSAQHSLAARPTPSGRDGRGGRRV
jgi:hypothetical protein